MHYFIPEFLTSFQHILLKQLQFARLNASVPIVKVTKLREIPCLGALRFPARQLMQFETVLQLPVIHVGNPVMVFVVLSTMCLCNMILQGLFDAQQHVVCVGVYGSPVQIPVSHDSKWVFVFAQDKIDRRVFDAFLIREVCSKDF